MDDKLSAEERDILERSERAELRSRPLAPNARSSWRVKLLARLPTRPIECSRPSREQTPFESSDPTIGTSGSAVDLEPTWDEHGDYAVEG